MMFNKTAVGILSLSLLSGCVFSTEEVRTEKFNLTYKDGSTFCEGTYRHTKRFPFSKETTEKIGIWECFHPNGKLRSHHEFDDSGNFVSGKTYNLNGGLVSSEVDEGDVSI